MSKWLTNGLEFIEEKKDFIVMPQPNVKKKNTVLENTKKNWSTGNVPHPSYPPHLPASKRLYVFVQYHSGWENDMVQSSCFSILAPSMLT